MLEHQPVLVPGPRAGHHRRLEERAQPAPTPLSPRLPSPGSLRSDLHPPNDRLSLALDQLLGSRHTGSYGSGLAQHLQAHGVTVVEVSRPSRQVRRRHGKSDVIDAIAAARAVLAGEATSVPKSHDGSVEALRTLKLLQRSANKARVVALNQLHNLVVTAPDDLRGRLRSLDRKTLLATCMAFRVRPDDDTLDALTRFSLRELAHRVAHLDDQLDRTTLR